MPSQYHSCKSCSCKDHYLRREAYKSSKLFSLLPFRNRISTSQFLSRNHLWLGNLDNVAPWIAVNIYMVEQTHAWLPHGNDKSENLNALKTRRVFQVSLHEMRNRKHGKIIRLTEEINTDGRDILIPKSQP